MSIQEFINNNGNIAQLRSAIAQGQQGDTFDIDQALASVLLLLKSKC